MATLVFDIETVARPWDAFDDFTKNQLLAPLNNSEFSAEQKANKEADIKGALGLSPLTGQIITVGIADLERQQRAVYYYDETDVADWEEEEVQYRPRTEQAMLEDFWEGAQSYDVFVTFAGRTFDAPYLAIRSAAHGIIPSKDLMEHRYLGRQTLTKHVDLQDQFSYYGALSRRPSLHLCCETLGVTSSKVAGVSGKDVAELFASKKFRDIARYNARDVLATAELYKKWYGLLAPDTFKNLDI